MKKERIAAFVLTLALFIPGAADAWYYDSSYYPVYYYDYYQYQPVYSYQQSTYYPQYYPNYQGYSTPSPYNYSYPVGDTDTFGYDICYWEGYGRSRCDFNPRQPVYDYWTGTWY